MVYQLLAELVVLLHLAFLLFVILGGLLALAWPRVAWLHLPALVWGGFIEITAGICPLTPLENELRRAAGSEGYQGDFIAHYLEPILYPPGLTPRMQLALGLLLVGANAAVYAAVWRRRRGARRPPTRVDPTP